MISSSPYGLFAPHVTAAFGGEMEKCEVSTAIASISHDQT